MLPLVAALVLAAPHVALLSAHPEGDRETVELRWQAIGTNTLQPPGTSLEIVPSSGFAGAVIPHTRQVVVVAQTAPMRDVTWASSLWLFDGVLPAKHLADRVAIGARPLVSPKGRVFIQRGVAGREPFDDAFRRVDDLTVDEVDLRTGAVRTVYSSEGQWTFPAGFIGDELLVYVDDIRGTRIDAVHIDTRQTRTLVPSLSPTAFDFVCDPSQRKVLFTHGDTTTHEWHLMSLSLDTRRLERLATGNSVALLPTVFPQSIVAFAPSSGAGLTTLDTATTLLPSLGDGYERVRGFISTFAVGVHEGPAQFPIPFAFVTSTQKRIALAYPKNARLDVAGVSAR